MSDVIREHSEIPPSQFVKVHQVGITFRIDGGALSETRHLTFDPAEVATFVWDPNAIQDMHIDDEDIVDLDAQGGLDEISTARVEQGTDYPTGVAGAIHLLTSDEAAVPHQWFRIPDTLVSVVRLLYEDPRNHQYYELFLPVRSRRGSANRGDFPKDAKSLFVDMIFLNGERCAAQRQHMHDHGQEVRRHCLVSPDGSPVQNCNGVVVIPPIPKTVVTANTVTCAFCYHYDNCRWVCTAAV